MYDHHIEEMTNRLYEAGLVVDKRSTLGILKEYWSDRIALVWCLEDVEALLGDRQIEPPMTDDEKREVLANMLRNQDASRGVSWDEMAAEIGRVLKARGGS